MSGPIVRKYGFPNHEQIFGKRPLEHGEDDAGRAGEKAEKAPDGGGKAEKGEKPKKA